MANVKKDSIKLFIVSGELSGDIHGSNLVKELKKYFSSIELYGTGGDRLKSLGQKQIYHISEMSIIGFVKIIRSFKKILDMIKQVKFSIEIVKPDIIILIDYPGFNLRLAKQIRYLNIQTVYFIPPQFWVWGRKRIFTLRDCTDKVISILPFEIEDLKNAGIDAVYVGNPIIDNFHFKFKSKKEFLSATSLKSNGKKIIGIFPGSRVGEITGSLNVFLYAASKLKDKYQFVISKVDQFDSKLFLDIMQNYKIAVLEDAQYDIMRYSDLVWTCSGTITLETALFHKPMIITYYTSSLNIFIAKLLSKLRMIGLPNIIFGKKFLPELCGRNFTVRKVISATETINNNSNEIISILKTISAKFLNESPSKNAAKEIFSLYNNKTSNNNK